jgi:hypothetical protein
VPRKQFLLLLTDGQPNESPKGGEANALKHFLEQRNLQQEHVQINTYGFGYNLNSAMLLDLATLGTRLFVI